MKANVRVTGADKVIANFDRYLDRAQELRKEGAMAGAEVVRDSAADKAPVASGNLRSNIVTEWDEKAQVAKVGPTMNAFYGSFQEFGTSRHAAQPFMRPAMDSSESAVKNEMARAISKATDVVRS